MSSVNLQSNPYREITDAWIEMANSERNAYRLGVLDAWMLAAVGDVTGMQEPKPTPEQCARYPDVEDLLRVPIFAIFLFTKP